jgi:hypothetical protein
LRALDSASRTRADVQRAAAQIMLFVLTMKRQIKHMIKHRYLPFTRGKQARWRERTPLRVAA